MNPFTKKMESFRKEQMLDDSAKQLDQKNAAKADAGLHHQTEPQSISPKSLEPFSNPEIEALICGWLLNIDHSNEQDSASALRLLAQVENNDFATPRYRATLSALRALMESNQPNGPTAVFEYAKEKKLNVGAATDLAQLFNNPIALKANPSDIEQGITHVRNYAIKRHIRSRLQARLNDLADKPVEQVIQALSDDVQALEDNKEIARAEPIHISEAMEALIDSFIDDQPASTPIPTGFVDLDRATNGGLRGGELILLGARPAMGKTALAIGIARNVSMSTDGQKVNVLVFSAEMSAQSLASRILSAESGVHAKVLRQNDRETLAQNHMNELLEVIVRFSGPQSSEDGEVYTRLWIDDRPGLSISQIRSTARQFVRQYGKTLIIIDYMQIINQQERLQNRGGPYDGNQAIGLISQASKSLARELDCPVIALSQLNRALESRTNKRPVMSDLRDSGSLEQDADMIWFLYRDIIYNEQANPTDAELIIGKQREGELAVIPLNFNAPLVRFENHLGRTENHYSAEHNY